MPITKHFIRQISGTFKVNPMSNFQIWSFSDNQTDCLNSTISTISVYVLQLVQELILKIKFIKNFFFSVEVSLH